MWTKYYEGGYCQGYYCLSQTWYIDPWTWKLHDNKTFISVTLQAKDSKEAKEKASVIVEENGRPIGW